MTPGQLQGWRATGFGPAVSKRCYRRSLGFDKTSPRIWASSPPSPPSSSTTTRLPIAPGVHWQEPPFAEAHSEPEPASGPPRPLRRRDDRPPRAPDPGEQPRPITERALQEVTAALSGHEQGVTPAGESAAASTEVRLRVVLYPGTTHFPTASLLDADRVDWLKGYTLPGWPKESCFMEFLVSVQVTAHEPSTTHRYPPSSLAWLLSHAQLWCAGRAQDMERQRGQATSAPGTVLRRTCQMQVGTGVDRGGLQ